MVFNAIATRFLSLAATVLLGRWLLTSDFGVYGLAMSPMAAMAGVLRDGGVRQLLVREHHRHDELVGTAFYMALAFNTLTGAALALLSSFSSFWTDDPAKATDVARVLLVIAICQPLNTPGAMLQAKLLGGMRFGPVSLIAGISACIRFGGAIVLAGFWPDALGALAFVLPLPACAIFEWIGFWYFNRERIWSRAAEPARWKGLLAKSVWILVGSFAIAMLNWGANPALAATSKDLDLVAVYFFAYNIVIQVGIVLSANIGQVLVPAFSRLIAEPDRLRAATLRAIRQLMLVAAPLSLGLAVTFPPLERLLWSGRWERAADAVRVMGLLYPFVVTLVVPLSLLQARASFRTWAMVITISGGLSMAGACLGGVLLAGSPDAVSNIAWLTGLLGGASSFAATLAIGRTRGIALRDSISATLPAWVLAAIAALPVIGLDDLVISRWHPVPRFFITGTVFTLLFVLLARVCVTSHLREWLASAPARVRPLASRLLLLPGAPR
jgi:O-antigen/teichoic acid export membrane protein